MRIVGLAVAALFILLSLLAGAGGEAAPQKAGGAREVTLYYFWGEGCPHCSRAKPFLEELQRRYPNLRIKSWEVLKHRENIPILMEMAKARNQVATGVPTFIIGDHMVAGFAKETPGVIEALVREAGGEPAPKQPEQKATPPAAASVTVPVLGRVDSSTVSLPFFTLVIAGLDSFNPCAFFVLFFLLSLLVHAHSRRRMLLIGGVFVLFSGVVYFLFMAAWLNLFLLAGSLPAVTVAAGVVALVVAGINIKDFFFFEQGVSLSIPEGKKPKLFARMRRLLRSGSLPAMLAGAAVLALAANSYELLCTAGFPMVYTRVLTIHRLPTTVYYLYLALYNLVYVIPLAVIVATCTATLGSTKLTERQGRVLKLLSGLMMLGLGLVLLIDPSLLNSPLASAGLLGGTLAAAAIIVLLSRKALAR